MPESPAAGASEKSQQSAGASQRRDERRHVLIGSSWAQKAIAELIELAEDPYDVCTNKVHHVSHVCHVHCTTVARVHNTGDENLFSNFGY